MFDCRGSSSLLSPPPSPSPFPGLSADSKAVLDRIGTKCINITNITSTGFMRMVVLHGVHASELEKIGDNLYRLRMNSMAMNITKYLAEKFNLQVICYQKAPGRIDENNNRLPLDFQLVVMLQGSLDSDEPYPENVEIEYNELLECILVFFFRFNFMYLVINCI